MVILSTPPRLPMRVALADDGGIRRVHFRIWQWTMSLVTILVTVWFITLGAIPGIIAVVVAKHILVAILVAGLDVNASEKAGL
jgi:hypothetical protein